MPVKQPEYGYQERPDTSDDFALYHWSPRVNRESIQEKGLRTRNPDLAGGFKFPYIAYALSPQLAWLLSAARTDYEVQHEEWDLWSTWAHRVKEWEVILFDQVEDFPAPKEYRVYRNIRPDHIWLVGTRTRDM